MKKKILYCALLVMIAVGVFVILKSIKYSHLDVTADNFIKNLKEDRKGIYEARLEECIPDNLMLLQSLELPYAPNCTFTKIRPDSQTIRLNILSHFSNLSYNVFYNEKKIAIWCNISNASSTYEPQLNTICDKLMMSGFDLRKSEKIKGSDILIKETDKSFLIVEIKGKYKGLNAPTVLRIGSYSKKRF